MKRDSTRIHTLAQPFSENKHGMELWCCPKHRDKAHKEREATKKKKKISKNDQE